MLQLQEISELDRYSQNSHFEDMPLSDTFLDGFGVASYQAMPAGLLSPDSSNHDLHCGGQESPVSPSLELLTSGDASQPVNKSLLKHPQDLRTYIDLTTIDDQPNASQHLLDESTSFLRTQSQQGNPSIANSIYTDAALYQSFAAPSDVSLHSHTATVPSKGSIEKVALDENLTSTHVPNNTSAASAPASRLHSPRSMYPSHLHHKIHPDLQQSTKFTMTAPDHDSTSQSPRTISSTDIHRSASHSSHRSQHGRFIDAQNEYQRFSLPQNYRPFQESSLRSSVIPILEQDIWDAGRFQTPQYPDPYPLYRQQSGHPPYFGYPYASTSREKFLYDYSPEQYPTQASSSPYVSLMSQASTEIGFDNSSPLSIKKELSSPSTDYVAPTPTLKSRNSSPKSKKKRRVKQELGDEQYSEKGVDLLAFQTADLTDLDPTDHKNVAALIKAMHNTDDVEDNPGMKKTWEKVRIAKAVRIKEVCVSLLLLTKNAQQHKGVPSGERRSLNHYESFETRFESLCETLRYQKTVCKHLIEPLYAQIVVDDPQYARERVQNNRRVNYQKAEAIRLGREHLGEKGQGKGRPTLKLKKRGWAQLEDSQDEENFAAEPVSDVALDSSPHVLGTKSARPNSRAPKKTKRSRKLISRQDHESSIPASSSPLALESEVSFSPGMHQNAYSPILQHPQVLSAHDRTWHGLAASPNMSTLNQSFDYQPGNAYGAIFHGNSSTGGGGAPEQWEQVEA